MEEVFWLTIILLFIGGYYALVVMPKQRAFKKHQKYVVTLQEGDEVITYGGLIGTITELDAEVGVAKIRIADGLEVRIITAALVQQYDPEEIAHNAKIGLDIQEAAE
jgi:preprotein translocase subunit YajC